jgi:hypothetical protein
MIDISIERHRFCRASDRRCLQDRPSSNFELSKNEVCQMGTRRSSCLVLDKLIPMRLTIPKHNQSDIDRRRRTGLMGKLARIAWTDH